MTEMHGKKRHGYMMEVSESEIFIIKYLNNKAVTCLVLDHNIKLKRITSPYCSYRFDGENVFSTMIMVDTNCRLINNYNQGQLAASSFMDRFYRTVGTVIVWE